MTYETWSVPYVDQMKPGQGVNLITGQAVASVIDLPTKPQEAPSFKQTEQSVITVDDYTKLLQVTAGFEGSAWTEDGKGTMKTSASFLQQESYNARSLGFVCYRAATTQTTGPSESDLLTIQLPDDAISLIGSDPLEFLNQYGTHFIAGFTFGGSFCGSILITASSERDRQAIASSFDVSFDAWGAGNGSINGSFADKVTSFASTGQAKVNASGMYVDPPSFDPSTVQAMQSYIDDQFVTDLGTGGQLTAICFPWERLGSVLALKGYVPGTLSPPIDTGVLDTLRAESRSLAYAINTAQYMQSSNMFVGGAAQDQLQANLQRLNEAQGRITDLTFSDLEEITASSVSAYVVSSDVLDDLTAIASGRATVSWSYSLDGAFTPNTTAPPGYTQGSTAAATPNDDATPTTLITADHEDGHLTCGFVYQNVAVPVGTQPPSSLQQQVQLMPQQTWKGKSHTGDPIDGSPTGKTTSLHWEGYDYDQVTVAFE